MIAGHDLDHLRQVEDIAKKRRTKRRVKRLLRGATRVAPRMPKLEANAEAELHRPWGALAEVVSAVALASQASPCRGVAGVETWAAGVRIKELVMVQNVGEYELEFSPDAFCNVDRFLDAEIQVPVVQATHTSGETAVPGV